MKRILEAISERANSFTKGQHLLAQFITDHCDKAAFMSSFDLAAVTGVSQSTVVRFAAALGYRGYGAFQDALQLELKYRLTTLEQFELLESGKSDSSELLSSIALQDALNVKKTVGHNPADVFQNLCTRLLLSGKIYLYGQGFCVPAVTYLASYLRILQPNVCCINQLGMEPLSAASGMDSGDLLLCIGLPPHRQATLELLNFAREREACTVVISESHDSLLAKNADISLIAECGDFGLGGSLAPLISLCCMIVCMLAKIDEKSHGKLKNFTEAIQFQSGEVQ